ncbi:LPXTG cell wall anchor domain-containing protein [Trueperella pecoris]|uniref:LPXTG cell wall anchor domain-containing protein n=1 Tax=Trueperella pecoris TaxID=2733571 RepID=A0A7M1QT26_9ACTO|nr:LPXTG cell wall anchor domain-containing protein [Trueperella pecoris]
MPHTGATVMTIGVVGLVLVIGGAGVLALRRRNS